MLNFSIGPGSNHLQELRQYVRRNSRTDSEVLSLLFQEIKLPIDEYLQNIIGLPFEYNNKGVGEHATFGMFHSVPNISSLDVGTLVFISRAAVSKAMSIPYPAIIRTDIGEDSVTIYYDVEELRTPIGYTTSSEQIQVRPSTRYSSGVSPKVMKATVAELVGTHRLPIARFGDINCYSVSVEEISTVISKYIGASGLSSDYVLLRDILQGLYPTYEELLDERSFIVNVGKICSELAVMYPEQAWKEAVNLERVNYHIGFLNDRYGKNVQSTGLRTSRGIGEQDHKRSPVLSERAEFLAAVYRDTRTKQELDNSELEMALKSTLGQLGYTDDQKLFTIVVKNQPSTNE